MEGFLLVLETNPWDWIYRLRFTKNAVGEVYCNSNRQSGWAFLRGYVCHRFLLEFYWILSNSCRNSFNDNLVSEINAHSPLSCFDQHFFSVAFTSNARNSHHYCLYAFGQSLFTRLAFENLPANSKPKIVA